MKKIIILIISITLLAGCSLGNTPTSKVEDLLSKYQMLDNNISLSYTNLTNNENLTQKQKERYQTLISNQYRNLSYEIKEEEIDGNTATVTVEIEVMDYQKIIKKYNNEDYTEEKYHDLILNDLENAKDKITYTVDFICSKDDKDNWQVDELTKEIKQKLLGIN